eukprot:CAMPEP_0167755032 /NCGR_PEP_ID=MMETSP0110_2-20121227/8599_1 /TAXON_ID=629695 /ORGANISM="Gymnochlora sp., Strain CCMP2014" /LENGTH=616 /DNA_ID=CAMNT_0007640975 /DNA_START=88 /DNA_END=1936 /DNA_ORIENTATION=-
MGVDKDESLLRTLFAQADMEKKGGTPQAMGAGGITSFEGLVRADAAWSRLRTSPPLPPKEFVEIVDGGTSSTGAQEFEAVICGGTLGIFVASALMSKNPNLRIAVIERGKLAGRDQDWNIARVELESAIELGVLSREEIEDSIQNEFNPMRVGFRNPDGSGFETDVKDVLNIGISPKKLIAYAKARFEAMGGTVFEQVGLEGVDISSPDDPAILRCSSKDKGEFSLSAKLVIDAMGSGSPIARQARSGAKPDGVCLVVGMCASSPLFEDLNKQGGDLIYANSPALKIPTLAQGQMESLSVPNGTSEVQLFWEAFPAGSGPLDRTTYMFAYMDTKPTRPSLQRMFEEYIRLMPEYQGLNATLEDLVNENKLKAKRLLFASFPSYSNSPITYPDTWHHITAVGDASGVQSPLSFGGFGALLRHLPRTVDGIADALTYGITDSESLKELNPYLPNLSSTWMMQRSMSAPASSGPFRPPLTGDSGLGEGLINDILASTFEEMLMLDGGKGESMQPFLQDVVQPGGLLGALAGVVKSKPQLVPRILQHVGPTPIFEWVGHVSFMLAYALAHSIASTPNARKLLTGDPKIVKPSDDRKTQFLLRRRLDAFKYGSGADFNLIS